MGVGGSHTWARDDDGELNDLVDVDEKREIDRVPWRN